MGAWPAGGWGRSSPRYPQGRLEALSASAHSPLSSRMSWPITLSLGSRAGSGRSSKLFQMENDEIFLES